MCFQGKGIEMKTNYSQFKLLGEKDKFKEWCEWVEGWNVRNRMIQDKRDKEKPRITYTRERIG